MTRRRTYEEAHSMTGDCPKGHPYEKHGYRLTQGDGRIACRMCTRARAKDWREKNRDDLNIKARQWYRDNPEKVKGSDLKAAYGITLEDYDEIFAVQGGTCAVCEQLSERELSVDHDHKTGQVRGLLCVTCNLKVGMIESPLYPRLLDYMEEHHVL